MYRRSSQGLFACKCRIEINNKEGFVRNKVGSPIADFLTTLNCAIP